MFFTVDLVTNLPPFVTVYFDQVGIYFPRNDKKRKKDCTRLSDSLVQSLVTVTNYRI